MPPLAPRFSAVLAVLLAVLAAGTAVAAPAQPNAAPRAAAEDTAPSDSEPQAATAADPLNQAEEAEDDALAAQLETEWDAEEAAADAEQAADAQATDSRCEATAGARSAESDPDVSSEDGSGDPALVEDPQEGTSCAPGHPVRALGAATVTQSLTLPAQNGRKALFLGRTRRTVTGATTLKLDVKLTKRGRAALKRRKGKTIKVRLTTTIKMKGQKATITRKLITLRA